MTRNDTPDKLEWSIRPHSGTDSAQWDWGIRNGAKTTMTMICSVITTPVTELCSCDVTKL